MFTLVAAVGQARARVKPQLQAWCKANGASELAVPKRIVVIEEIPVLGSGKMDYVVLQRMAAERFAEQKAA